MLAGSIAVTRATLIRGIRWSIYREQAVASGGHCFTYEGILFSVRQGVIHWLTKRGRLVPENATPSKKCQHCLRQGGTGFSAPWHFQCPHWSWRDCATCGRSGWSWPCYCQEEETAGCVQNAHCGRPASSLGASFSSAAVKWAMACASGSAMGVVAIGIRSWAPCMRTRYR